MVNRSDYYDRQEADEKVKLEVLLPLESTRVVVEGVFIRTSPHRQRNFLNALIEDITVEVPDRTRHELSHAWIREAGSFARFAEGTRVRFTAEIRKYKREDGSTGVGLLYPRHLEELIKPVALQTVAQEEPRPLRIPPTTAPKLNLLQAFQAFKAEVEKLGGATAVHDLLEAVVAVGGWDAALKIKALEAESGGEIRELLGLLKTG